MTIVLTEVWRYPAKSMRGERVARADVEPWGLAGDRRWMVVDDDGRAVTGREVNELLLLRPSLTEAGLRLSADGVDALDVAVPDPAGQVPVRIFGSSLTGAAAGPEAEAWLTAVLGRPSRLVHLDDPRRRPTEGGFGRPEDRVSFADGYPLLLAAEESLAALNEATGADEPLPMTRFRPNLVVAGARPWAEDDWRRVRVGGPDGVTFRAVKGCGRCVMTTIDPDTAERTREPLRTLARTRRFDGQPWFAVNLVPDLPVHGDGPWPQVREGDAVEVLEAAEPGDGPLRARS